MNIKQRPTRRQTIIICIFLAIALLAWWIYRPRLAEGVTRSGLLDLRVGMTESEVRHLLGEPLFKEKTYGPHPIGEIPVWRGSWTWSYGEQGLFGLGRGFEISVNFHKGRMTNAGAERFDLGFWWCNNNGCPVVWNEEVFNRLPR